ncbi:MAG: extracellular solute-binding protein [Oscillospiraceae bacterium]|nr:extracellular solute-binding protein [Oscillospiraceae bacterium]
MRILQKNYRFHFVAVMMMLLLALAMFCSACAPGGGGAFVDGGRADGVGGDGGGSGSGVGGDGGGGGGDGDGGGSGADGPAWARYAGDEITLGWYINFSWYTTTWGGNLVSDTITEETGVSINFITPGGNEREKLDAMISGGDLPDLITLGFWEPQIEQLIAGGLVYPLNELADAHDPSFWQVADAQRLGWYTRPDGNVYAYPNSSYSPADYDRRGNIGSNQSFLVRADIYEALGSPDMTTPDGFSAAIRDALGRFPSSNTAAKPTAMLAAEPAEPATEPAAGGKPLLSIGLYDFDKDGCFSLEEILMNFLAVPFEKDGKKYDRYADPDYIRWLKTFRELYEQGYISDETFVDRRAQVIEKVSEGRYFCMLYQHTDIADQQLILHNKNPGGTYIATDGPMNARRDKHTLPGVGINGWTVTLISKNCAAPERAIALMTYMMSERGQKLLYCGVEGATYDTGEDGRPVLRTEVLDMLNTDRMEYNRLYGADNTYWMLQDNAMQLDWQPPPQPPLAQPKEWTYPYTVYMPEYDVSITDGDAMNANRLIREEWGRVLPALILAPDEAEFDRLFEEFLAKREDLGHDLVTGEWMRLVEDAKRKLDMK